MPNPKVDIFLSYSRKDIDAMRQLRNDLRAAGFTVWIDETGLKPGTASWQAAIEKAINDARCIVVILSPEAKQSRWVEIEVSVAEESGLPVFPVLARGDNATAVLFRLRTTQRVDVRNDWQAVKEQLIPALHDYLRSGTVKFDSKAFPITENPKPTSYRWLWGVGIAALLLLVMGIYYLPVLWAMYGPSYSSVTPQSTPTAGQAVALVDTPTPPVLPTNSLAIASTATPVPPTDTVLPTSTSLPPTATALPMATPTPNLTLTVQSDATMRAAIDLTLIALAPTETPTLLPSPTNTPISPTVPTATWTNPKDRAVYVWIPGGTFTMGSSAEDLHAQDDEKPPNSVPLEGFWIMQTEVTNEQYTRCVTAGICEKPDNNIWYAASYAEHPVVDVDWSQAKTYAEWVGGRLPSEAEWEYACRGTDGRIYPWGNQSPSVDWLNYYSSGKNMTAPVGSYPVGANGLYDMAGNVWEWTSSLYKPYPYKSNDGREDLKTEGRRTLRGGSFSDLVVFDVRCAARFHYNPDFRSIPNGFRVASSGP